MRSGSPRRRAPQKPAGRTRSGDKKRSENGRKEEEEEKEKKKKKKKKEEKKKLTIQRMVMTRWRSSRRALTPT